IGTQPCPKGWKRYNISCYLFVTPKKQIQRMTWQDSRAVCLGYGADMVSILDSSEVKFIHQQTNADTLRNHNFWIGLIRNKTTSDPKRGWIWSDGNNFTNPWLWKRNEPNNYQNNENCAQLYAPSRMWIDNDCAKLFPTICKKIKDMSLRLQGPLSENGTGRLEVFYNGQWGTICDDKWDIDNAKVVCRQLGYKYAFRELRGIDVPDGTGQIWLDDVNCIGNERRLASCSHTGWGNNDCKHKEDAGVECLSQGLDISLRLEGPSSEKGTGRVEIYANGRWGTICDDQWDINDAKVVCRQLGYKDAVKALQGGNVPNGTGQIWLNNVVCNGNERSLATCSHAGWGNHECSHNEDAGVECSPP
ncbi:deleted in malignant brain tumors 1 -like, partial [Paramuricea clavata]